MNPSKTRRKTTLTTSTLQSPVLQAYFIRMQPLPQSMHHHRNPLLVNLLPLTAGGEGTPSTSRQYSSLLFLCLRFALGFEGDVLDLWQQVIQLFGEGLHSAEVSAALRLQSLHH